MKLYKDEGIAILHQFEAIHRYQQHKFTQNDKRALSNLTERIHEEMKNYGETGVFIKLSSRSPKDSVLASQKMVDLSIQELDAMKEKYGLAEPDNIKITAFVRASCFAMNFKTAEEAVEMIVNSQRVYSDLVVQQLQDIWNLNIIFREWDDSLIPENEVRVFVFNKQITAMTQYYQYLHVPYLEDNKGEIEMRINQYFEDNIAPNIPFINYSFDLAILPDEIKVVEINNPVCSSFCLL
eukprot:TRINITY_DN1007_c0_g1_i12.p1 TRINITY_DN1007_c0_g1~~TRINITY_DN1007_c0_g1_i12.p1  ORF type:complete len:279 (+),score=58.37 TRINITY_DN1007_c0_g1_i12:126-839(+)